jgi:CBS-domain-containing membrane protein
LSVRQRAPRRGGIKGELALAALPTLTVIGIFLALKVFSRQTFLFASLASSAFLIYQDPENGMNEAKVMIPAHVTAALLGFGTFLIFGEGYLSGAVAMGLTITVLILLGIVHPPAVSTSLIFAFRVQQAQTLLIFVLALAMVAVLYIVQRVAVALLHRIVPGS